MTTNQTTNQNAEPTTELIDEIRNRLATVPPDVLERVHDALKYQPIQNAGSLLWKAGVCLSSAELYAYRRTLFPPNALVDPDTQGAPILRNPAIHDPPSSNPGSSIHSSINPTIHSSMNPPSPGSALLNDLRDLIRRYIVLPEMAAETL